MIFIDPSLEEVFQSLINNDHIINYLKQQKLLITKSSLYKDFSTKEIENMTNIIFSNNVSILYDVSQLLLDNKEVIKSNSMYYLVSHRIIWDELAKVFGVNPEDLTEDTYKNIIFTYKYCTVSSFFQNNKETFIPESDMMELENNPAANAFVDAVMKEFDKLDAILSKCCEYLDYDKIPWDIINYLTQLLGFEKTTLDIKNEKSFREIAKNILDVYRIKGTNYSFELFFKFLGFNIEISEFYFDRRLYYLRDSGNLETSYTNKNKAEFYLTSINPTKNELNNVGVNEIVLESDISPQYSLNEFNDLCEKYGAEAVLGYSSLYPVYDEVGNVTYKEYKDKVYKFFKTNAVYYSLKGEKNTSNYYLMIVKCLKFFTPSYIRKAIKVDVSKRDESEDIGFDGDGNKKPDANGNFKGFELLDNEDWSQYNKEDFIHMDENGKEIGVSNEYRSNKDGSDTYLPYKNSYGGSEFRLPIGYKIINKSANRFLTGIGNDIEESYLDYKRNKFLLIKDENTLDILPYYSIPPYVNNPNNIQNNFYKKTKDISLTGKDSVKEVIKNSNMVTKINYVIENSIEDFFYNDIEFNKLKSISITNRDAVLVDKEDYNSEEGTDRLSCYNNNFKGYIISNVTNESDLDSLPEKNNFKYYDHPEIYKKLSFGDHILVSSGDSNKGSLYLYRFGNYKLPIQKDFLKDYLDTYKKYINSFNYAPLELCKENPSVGFNIKVYSLKDMQDDIDLRKKEILESIEEAYKSSNLDNVKDLSYISDNIYSVSAKSKFYTLQKIPVPSDMCIKNNTIFENKALAETFFNTHDKECNYEYYIQDEKQLYTFEYANKKYGDLIYSLKDEKLYKVIDKSHFEEIKDFAGKLSINEENGKYTADINLYDSCWIGYDEISDEEEFLFYNTEHEVIFPEAKLFEKTRIPRPVKYISDRYFDNDEKKSKDVFIPGTSNEKDFFNKRYYKTIGQNIIDSIISETADNFSNELIINNDIKLIEVDSSIYNINPNLYNLYEEGSESITTDTTFVKGKKYFCKTYAGLLTLIEKNMESITKKENYRFDYCSTISDFFRDYYRIVLLDNWETRNFLDIFVNDFQPNEGETEYTGEKKDLIKKYYNISMLQITLIISLIEKDLQNSLETYFDLFNINNIIKGLENSLSSLDDYLKQYMYNKFVCLYREKYIDDSSPIEQYIKGAKPFYSIPRLTEKYNGKAGTYKMPNTLISSYINNGGKKDEFIKLKFSEIKECYINRNKEIVIIFKINHKDFVECLGYDYGTFYNKNIINNKKDIAKELKNMYNKQFKGSKPYFLMKDESSAYYNGKEELTLWQKIRKYLSLNYSNCSIESYDANGIKISNELGIVNDEKGMPYPDTTDEAIINKRIKDSFESGYIELSLKNNINIDEVIDIDEIYDFLVYSKEERKTILELEEKKYIYGFLTINKLTQKYIDNHISLPHSLEWIEKDSNNFLPTECISLGDDRSLTIKKIFQYSTEEYLDSIINSSREPINDPLTKMENDFSYKNNVSDLEVTDSEGNVSNIIIPSYICEVVVENGKYMLKVPTGAIHTSNIKEVTLLLG